MADDVVDVLIIGAGASGAAVAWSLADTRMRIVCFEQGDWTNPSDYPSTAANWESQAYGPYHIDPNVRARDTDYPINNDESAVAVVNFNGVGGSTILYGAHFPRLHPSDFKVRTLDGVADDWPIDYDTLRAVLRHQRPHDGGVGSSGRSDVSGQATAAPAAADGTRRRNRRARLQQTRLALVAVRQRDHFAAVPGP